MMWHVCLCCWILFLVWAGGGGGGVWQALALRTATAKLLLILDLRHLILFLIVPLVLLHAPALLSHFMYHVRETLSLVLYSFLSSSWILLVLFSLNSVVWAREVGVPTTPPDQFLLSSFKWPWPESLPLDCGSTPLSTQNSSWSMFFQKVSSLDEGQGNPTKTSWKINFGWCTGWLSFPRWTGSCLQSGLMSSGFFFFSAG